MRSIILVHWASACLSAADRFHREQQGDQAQALTTHIQALALHDPGQPALFASVLSMLS
jgi:hypothetical protein